MEIKFADGEAGFHEASALQAIGRYALDCDPTDSNEIQVISTLQATGDQYVTRAEFDSLRERVEKQLAGTSNAGTHGSIWRILFGPSRREILLSAQRSAALGRAERAEQSSFDALAEMAQIARERDAALARVAELEKSLNAAHGGSE